MLMLRQKLRTAIDELVEYLKTMSYGLWLVAGAVFAAWDLLAGLRPENEALQAVPEWLPVLAAALAFLVGPFIAFRRLRRRLRAVEMDRDAARADQLHALSAKKLELFYGDTSRRTRKQRVDGLRAEWEPLASAIRAGDYRLAAKVHHVAAFYLPLLHQVMPHGSAGYLKLRDEIHEVCDLAEQHLFNLRQRAARLPDSRD